MSKWAPKDDAGRTPWVRHTYSAFGRTNETILYTSDGRGAVKHAYGRSHLETVTVRRATVDDLATLHVDQNYQPKRKPE